MAKMSISDFLIAHHGCADQELWQAALQMRNELDMWLRDNYQFQPKPRSRLKPLPKIPKIPKVPLPMKISECSHCGTSLPQGNFYRHRDQTVEDGYRYVCPKCEGQAR